jgi:hypothetical protein
MQILTLCAAFALASVGAERLAAAGDGFAPTVSFGMFFEFGDEAGSSGGFEVWAGGSYYPSVDRDAKQTTSFVSAGLELRTGLIPLLTGPNEISPQLRVGLAFLGGVGYQDNDTEFRNLTLAKAKIYGIAGYRWASGFGFDNMKGKRKSEDAFRFGIGGVIPAFPAAIDFPVPDGADFIVDVNRDGTVDRVGFDVVVGF